MAASTKIKGSKKGNGANSARKDRKYDRRHTSVGIGWRKNGLPAKAGKRAKGKPQTKRTHQYQSVNWWHKHGGDWGATDRETGLWVGGKCWCGRQHILTGARAA